MSEFTKEEKLKIFEKLPKELQNLMQSEDTGAFLLHLGEKYNLDDEKTSLLSKIVGDVILGITPVTSLAQEINSKVTSDAQAAMNLAQELYSDLLSPVTAPVKPRMPVAFVAPTAPALSDRYREPTSGAPEIVDLRKTPPSPAEAGYGGQRPPIDREGELPPGLPIAAAPIPPLVSKVEPPKPQTFTKPVEPLPLIEAEPHLPARISPEISAGKIMPPPPVLPAEKPMADLSQPQYIIRPPGLPPTDMPHDVLDLRKDKGEF